MLSPQLMLFKCSFPNNTHFNKINITLNQKPNPFSHTCPQMHKGIPYANKIIKRREQERIQVLHKQNLRNARPLTTNIDVPFEAVANPFVNNKKKDMLHEDRFTEIQRENRMLLEKIHTIMSKKPTFKQQKLKRNSSINHERQRMNKSLNQVYRKKQLGDIQIENAKLLKRIMDKKSDYDSKKLKEDWKKQKQVIKNIANYPFIIRDRIYKGRKKSLTSHSLHQPGFTANIQPQDNMLSSPIQLVRIRNLSGHNFLITVKYDGNSLQILGDNKSTKEIKIIEIPKEEGLEFIQYECDGKIELIFECLRYDPNQKVLYLVGKEVDLDGKDQEENQEEKFNTDDGIAENLEPKQLQNQNQKGENEKGLKKRQMSNINEIQNSQIETEPHKLTQNNFNMQNTDQINPLMPKSKSRIQISDENGKKDLNEENNVIEKPLQNLNQATANNEANLNPPSVPSEDHKKQNAKEEEPLENKEPLIPVEGKQGQDKQLDQKDDQKAVKIQNQQAGIPQAAVKKQDSQQICGIKSEFELTSMLQKAIG